MLPKFIIINKTVSRRLEEYQYLLEEIENPCSDVVDVWASIFEELTIIGVNWQALWILSEENCRKYDVVFPTAVIVKVHDFNWKELIASVRVLAVQEDIILPSVLDVPVIELHPIQHQEYDDIELRNTEDWLDKCRYFFNNLWYPWDAKMNVSIKDWCEKHLQNRLFMQSDIKNGVFDKPIVNYLRSLLLEAQDVIVPSDGSLNEHDDKGLTTVQRYIRRKIIKTELDLFEKPELRQGMILLKTKEKHLKSCLSLHNAEARFVWSGGSMESLVENLKLAQTLVPADIGVKVCASFQEALNESCTNDLIMLPCTDHVLSKFRGIQQGGVITGIYSTGSRIFEDASSLSRAIMFECRGNIQMENLTITKPSGILIQVFDGTVKLKNCRLMSSNGLTSIGIVVVSGSKLILEKCELHGFGTGITLQRGASAMITNTQIKNCHEGIKMTDETSLTLNAVNIKKCSSFAILLESRQINSEKPIIGNENLLGENIRETWKADITGLSFENNESGNVAIKKASTVLSYEEIKDDLSPEIICLSDDGEFISPADSDDENQVFGEDVDDVRVTLEKAL